MIVRVIAAAVIASIWASASMAADDYPIDQFERVTQCMSDPSCSVEKENRIDGPVNEAEDLTYRYPLCIGGCVMICTTEACWCETDDKCG